MHICVALTCLNTCMCELFNPLNIRLSCSNKAFRKYTNSSLKIACHFTGSCTRNTSEFLENNYASHLQIRTALFQI